MKVYRYDGQPIIIPRQHIPFILLSFVPFEIAWAHIPLVTGELVKAGFATSKRYKPRQPIVIGVGGDNEYFRTTHYSYFRLNVNPNDNLIEIHGVSFEDL
jgi:hypothetical protein